MLFIKFELIPIKIGFFIVQGLWPDFGATLKILKKSNFDRNQLKLSMKHKHMYMYQEKL